LTQYQPKKQRPTGPVDIKWVSLTATFKDGQNRQNGSGKSSIEMGSVKNDDENDKITLETRWAQSEWL